LEVALVTEDLIHVAATKSG